MLHFLVCYNRNITITLNKTFEIILGESGGYFYTPTVLTTLKYLYSYVPFKTSSFLL